MRGGFAAINAIIVVSLAILCSSCATYKEPTGDVATASFYVLDGGPPSGYNYWSHQFFILNNKNDCKSAVQFAINGSSYPNTSNKPIKVLAGSRVYFSIWGSAMSPVIIATYNAYCKNIVSVIPEAGHTYYLSQDYIQNGCSASLIDVADGHYPPSYVAYPSKSNC